MNEGLRVNYIGLVADFDDKTFFPFEYDRVKQANTAFNGNLNLVYNSQSNWRILLACSSGLGPRMLMISVKYSILRW